jgi:hypothetical protein
MSYYYRSPQPQLSIAGEWWSSFMSCFDSSWCMGPLMAGLLATNKRLDQLHDGEEQGLLQLVCQA